MLKLMKNLVGIIIISLSVVACSSINSLEPFNDKQAKQIIKQWYRSNGIYDVNARPAPSQKTWRERWSSYFTRFL
jgi:hypothetical protein